MKSKVVPLIMFAMAAFFAVVAYYQKERADAEREKVVELYREIQRVKQESEAARVEAAKLRTALDMERKKTSEAMGEAQKKEPTK